MDRFLSDQILIYTISGDYPVKKRFKRPSDRAIIAILQRGLGTGFL